MHVQANAYIIYYSMVVFDLGIALLILFAVWFICEWLIRRKRPTS